MCGSNDDYRDDDLDDDDDYLDDDEEEVVAAPEAEQEWLVVRWELPIDGLNDRQMRYSVQSSHDTREEAKEAASALLKTPAYFSSSRFAYSVMRRSYTNRIRAQAELDW